MQYRPLPVENPLSISSLFTASRRKFADNYRFEGESHDFYEMVCIVDGRVGVTADNAVYLLASGQLIVHRPNEFHKIWSDGVEADVLIFSFRADPFPDFAAGGYRLSPEQLFTVCDLFKQAEQALQLDRENVVGIRDAAHAALLVKRLEIFLLTVLVAEPMRKATYRSRGADNYMRIVETLNGLLDQTPSVGEIAAACNMSVPTLEKAMRQYTGHGVSKHLTVLKLKRAVELLDGGMSVKETAYTLGFDDPNYFSTVFKKHFGISPTGRNNNR